ncbi:MAG: hypothetical protein Q4B28_03675 [bacterium]|nr:hypothetical protein [bacterium]
MLLILISLSLSSLLICSLILTYYFFTGYHYANIELTTIFPAITKWGLLLGTLSVLILLS